MNGLLWTIGSCDNTKEVVDIFINETKENSNLEIKYFSQENQGKMVAINNLVNKVSDDSTFIAECDSDDYFSSDFVKILLERYNLIKNKENIYALCFLKNDENLCNIGSLFKSDNYETNMFNLYFKDGLTGDKALVYLTNIRKQFKYIFEAQENFCTEARLHHKMDKKYNVVCFNSSIIICKYLDEGYSKNIKNLFKKNPFGHYEYFKEILQFNMDGVLFSKRLYAIKHYILFSYLTKNKNNLKNIKNKLNKFLFIILYIPGIIKSYIYEKKD